MFVEKPVQNKVEKRIRKISLLTQQLQKCNFQQKNPFQDYARFDGNVRIISSFVVIISRELSSYLLISCRLKLAYQPGNMVYF